MFDIFKKKKQERKLIEPETEDIKGEQKVKLTIEADSNFTIENGELRTVDRGSFFVDKTENEIIISDSGSCSNNSMNTIGNGNTIFRNSRGGGISISNNTICVNGFKITVKGSSIEILGEASEVNYNGANILNGDVSPKEKSEPNENEYTQYELSTESISAIEIQGAGAIVVKDNQCLSDESLMFAVSGSGDIILDTNGHFAKSINTSVMGSGDINISKVQSNSLKASVTGSGDIVFKNSDFNNATLSIMGSGDIDFKASSAKSVNKNVMGSGDISGI